MKDQLVLANKTTITVKRNRRRTMCLKLIIDWRFLRSLLTLNSSETSELRPAEVMEAEQALPQQEQVPGHGTSSPGVVLRFWEGSEEEEGWICGCLKTSPEAHAPVALVEGVEKAKAGWKDDVQTWCSLISHCERGNASTLTSETAIGLFLYNQRLTWLTTYQAGRKSLKERSYAVNRYGHQNHELYVSTCLGYSASPSSILAVCIMRSGTLNSGIQSSRRDSWSKWQKYYVLGKAHKIATNRSRKILQS